MMVPRPVGCLPTPGRCTAAGWRQPPTDSGRCPRCAAQRFRDGRAQIDSYREPYAVRPGVSILQVNSDCISYLALCVILYVWLVTGRTGCEANANLLIARSMNWVLLLSSRCVRVAPELRKYPQFRRPTANRCSHGC